MSYATVEARLQLLLQGLTGTFARNDQVTRGDWRGLDGGQYPLAVLYPGSAQQKDSYAAGAMDWAWTVQVDLFQRFLDDGSSITALEATRDAVLQHLQKYPSLNGMYGVALGPIAVGDLGGLFDKDGNGPFFLIQTLTIPVTELVTVTIAEGG